MRMDAFTVLLLLVSGVSAGIVLPPTKLTVSCQNVTVTVSWESSKQKPQALFRLDVQRSDRSSLRRDVSDHQFDLSSFVWESEEHYMDFYSVNVKAVEEGIESNSVSETFAFNDLKTTHIKCQLDFPPVELNENDSGATMSFMNPLVFYRELKQAADTASFEFTAYSKFGVFKEYCPKTQENCKLHISFAEGEEKCVKLNGTLFDGDGVGQIAFIMTDWIYATNSTEVHVLALTIMLFVLALVTSVIIIIICKVKAWTLKTHDIPKPVIRTHNMLNGIRWAPVDVIQISNVGLLENPASISSEEDDPSSNIQPPVIVCSSEEGYTEGSLSELYKSDDNSADDSLKTGIVSIDLEEEEEVEVYDRPHALQVDMATYYMKR